MPQLIYTIEEYITEERQKDSIWMVFNTRYNEIHALKKKLEENEAGLFRLYDEQFTNYKARQEFLDFMQENFPETILVEVFDLVSRDWLHWPYLGSIAIDADIGSDVYKALCEKYGDAYGEPKDINHVLWVMPYDEAKVCHERRCEEF
jgi:hypothetical protein